VNTSSLLARADASPVTRRLASAVKTGGMSHAIHADGAPGSLRSFLIAALSATCAPIVCLTETAEEAAYLKSDLDQILGDEASLLLPPTDHRPYDPEHVEDAASVVARSDVLQTLAKQAPPVLIGSLGSILPMVPARDHLLEASWAVATGDTIDPSDAVRRLVEQGFERVEFAESPGEIALRGGILDIYPWSGEYPYRIEFFGDEIDSIREFDPRDQRSVSRLTHARITPNVEATAVTTGAFSPIFDYLPDSCLYATVDEERILGKSEEFFDARTDEYNRAIKERGEADVPEPDSRFLSRARLESFLLQRPRLQFGSFVPGDATETISLGARPQPIFHKNMELLRQNLRANHDAGLDTTILCDSHGQLNRLLELLAAEVRDLRLELKVDSLHEGFVWPEAGIAVYTDHQIFDRYHRPTARRQKRTYGGLTLREVQNLKPGDFVVHVDYGIGRFAGLHKITVREKQQEAVKLLFRDSDVLYVNVNALYKLHKFTGKEGHQPTLTKLGSGQWEKAKARTKSRVKDIARDLIKLYAKRKASEGFAFSADSVWQQEMEASFRYEDTPDQATTVEAVKLDMQQPVPMDRLVCGDVGFGKTEIAVRAAFKAVQDGKQVAVLVPTTILADQHFRTFGDRLSTFPVRVEALSRFRTAAQQKAIIEATRKGDVDVVIGTHRLISKDVRFKDLGLLIIDEEQRFGVSAKERLRQLRAEVDTLTLTATPIPRTLQFSLLGARDLSIITTPPPNRQPIVTEIHGFNKDLIRDAILYEISRGGQTFFIHNRIKSIEEVSMSLRAMLPDVRIRTAHGQMKAADLEKVMADFIDGRFDVLVSTNIIENGLDIPNANTIIVNHADRFGLSELHQLRGRVGRSDRKAFCYMLVRSVTGLTREAKMRLQSLEEFSDLGGGFNIAMRDLDIRGAGNMLGGEQSGFIEDVGFETYHQILDEAVTELREGEFADVFDATHVPRPQETVVDVEEDTFIPDSYVTNNVERLNMYRRLSTAASDDEIASLRLEFLDRFGPVPPEVDNLLDGAQLRLLGQRLRLGRVLFKNKRLFLYPPTQEKDPYFYDHIFYTLLKHLDSLDRRYVLRDEKGKKLRAIIQDIDTLRTAIAVMHRLQVEADSIAA
jgi:transcription-repair coupling factor (superfamily II helicase)